MVVRIIEPTACRPPGRRWRSGHGEGKAETDTEAEHHFARPNFPQKARKVGGSRLKLKIRLLMMTCWLISEQPWGPPGLLESVVKTGNAIQESGTSTCHFLDGSGSVGPDRGLNPPPPPPTRAPLQAPPSASLHVYTYTLYRRVYVYAYSLVFFLS